MLQWCWMNRKFSLIWEWSYTTVRAKRCQFWVFWVINYFRCDAPTITMTSLPDIRINFVTGDRNMPQNSQISFPSKITPTRERNEVWARNWVCVGSFRTSYVNWGDIKWDRDPRKKALECFIFCSSDSFQITLYVVYTACYERL